MQTFRQFINESQEELEALKYLRKVGLIGDAEFVKSVFELDPSLVGRAEVTLTVDYDFAAQHDSHEVEQLLLQWFDELNAEGEQFYCDRDSLEVSDWEVEDYEWDPDSDESEWNSEQQSASFSIFWLEGTTLDGVRAWVDGLLGRAFSDFEVELTQEPKIGI
jgi:hypothetical protein